MEQNKIMRNYTLVYFSIPILIMMVGFASADTYALNSIYGSQIKCTGGGVTFVNATLYQNFYNTTEIDPVWTGVRINYYNISQSNSLFCMLNGTNCGAAGNQTFNQTLTNSLYYPISNPSNFINNSFNESYNGLIGNASYLNSFNEICLTNQTGCNFTDIGGWTVTSTTISTLLNVNVSGNITAKYKSADGSIGITNCYDSAIGGQVCMKDGIVTSFVDDPSDITLKSNRSSMNLNLSKFKDIQTMQWNWNVNYSNKEGKNGYGLVAQDFMSVYPELVSDGKYIADGSNRSIKVVNYLGLMALNTKMIQMLEPKVSQLQSLNYTINISTTHHVITKTDDYNIKITDDFIYGDTSSKKVIVTLPSAVGIQGKTYTFTKKNSGVKNFIIKAQVGQFINDLEQESINNKFGTRQIMSDGANWIIISKNIN